MLVLLKIKGHAPPMLLLSMNVKVLFIYLFNEYARLSTRTVVQ